MINKTKDSVNFQTQFLRNSKITKNYEWTDKNLTSVNIFLLLFFNLLKEFILNIHFIVFK